MFVVKEVPQMASIQFWRRSGGGISERGEDSSIVEAKGIADAHGRLMVVMVHNSDIPDGWEREAEDPAVLLQVLTRCLLRRHQRHPLCDDSLGLTLLRSEGTRGRQCDGPVEGPAVQCDGPAVRGGPSHFQHRTFAPSYWTLAPSHRRPLGPYAVSSSRATIPPL